LLRYIFQKPKALQILKSLKPKPEIAPLLAAGNSSGFDQGTALQFTLTKYKLKLENSK
jgi:hypothetical protein